MNQKNKLMEVYGLWFVDLIAIGISFALSTYIRFGNFKDMGDKGIHFQVCLLFLLFCTIYTFFLDWNRNFLRRSIWKELLAILQYHVIMILIVQTIMYFLKWADVFSRAVMILFPIVNVLLTLGLHLMIKKALRLHYQSDLSKIKVLVITQREMADQVVETLKDSLDLNYQLVGIACPEMGEEIKGEISGVPLISLEGHFLEDVTLMALDEVFVYVPELRQKQIQKILKGFDEMGVDCHYCLEMPGTHSYRGTLDSFGSYSVITYTRFRSSYKKLLIKRMMDIVGGLVGMLITLLVFPFVAIAIKLDSPGPVLFSQIRIGRNGRRFKIYKFRSMYMDAEERKKEL
ncbi:MAG: sugar transferase, partial [Bacillota bacterium]|nr:sugar transferase [Bacillota bacterium]